MDNQMHTDLIFICLILALTLLLGIIMSIKKEKTKKEKESEKQSFPSHTHQYMYDIRLILYNYSKYVDTIFAFHGSTSDKELTKLYADKLISSTLLHILNIPGIHLDYRADESEDKTKYYFHRRGVDGVSYHLTCDIFEDEFTVKEKKL